MSNDIPNLPPNSRSAVWWALIAGIIGLIVCAFGGWYAPVAFFPAYLAAHQFFLGLGLGCMVLLMIYHLTGGAWGFLLRRILEAGSRTVPAMAILFIPLFAGLKVLFPWARPELREISHLLQHQRPYSNVPFFWVRSILYFVVWIGTIVVLNRWSRRQDETGGPEVTRRLATFSAIGLLAFGISINFAAVDWQMSLQPAYHSTMVGPLYGSGQVLSAQAVAIIVLTALLGRTALDGYVSSQAINDLGNLLLTFVIVWAYMVYFDYMLAWIANLRHEATWFLPRTLGAWGWVAAALVVLHLAVPFFLLLSRDVKCSPRALAAISALLLAAHLVFWWLQVLPAFPYSGAGFWINPAAVIGVGGIWLADYLWELGRYPILPAHDPSAATALQLRQESEEELEIEEDLVHAQ